MLTNTKRRIATLVVGLVATALLVGGGAAGYAALTSHSASSLTKFQARTENAAWSSSPAANTFVDVPGATLSVVVPSGAVRMHEARFTAESRCTGGTTLSWCSVRVVRVSPSGAITELNPISGTDFAFDTSGGDTWQSGAIARTSYYLSAATYTYKVQAAVVNGATTVRLDDWAFSVTSYAP